MKKEGRGAYDYALNNDLGVLVCGWLDNKRVVLASNYAGINPIDKVKRWDGKRKEKIDVPRPKIVN